MEGLIGCTSRPLNDLPYAEAYGLIAAAGYTDVGIFANQGAVPVRADSSKEEIAGVRRAAASAGVVLSLLLGRTQLNQSMDEAVEDYRRLIGNAAAVGVRWLLDCGTGDAARFEDYFELMRRVAPEAEAVGIGITMKPHGGISLTAKHLLEAHRRVGHPAFGISFDPGNIIYYTAGAQRPETDVDGMVDTLSTVIVKDCRLDDGLPNVVVTPGDGLVDFPFLLKRMVIGGFTGPYYVECVGGKDHQEVATAMAFTLGFLRGILATT